MALGPLLLVLVSATLIVAGVIIMLRDVRAKRAPAPLPNPPARVARAALPTAVASQPDAREPKDAQRFGDSNSEVTIVRREARAASAHGAIAGNLAVTPSGVGSAFAALQSAVTAITSEVAADGADTAAESQRWPSVESRWPLIENLVEQSAARLNDAMAPVALRIGPAGEAGWSFKNRGYGSYRRISIGGRSVAWLRTETNQENAISLKVRAHAIEQALLNASASLQAAGASAPQMLEALSTCLRPSAEYAAWAVPKPAQDDDSGVNTWSDLGVLTTDAYTIAAGALREAQADLSEVSRPTWDPASGRTRWRLAVSVGKARAANITVDLDKRHFEIASLAASLESGRQRTDLGRKRRLDLADLTAHSLAEAIAASAWPAVAAALEQAAHLTPEKAPEKAPAEAPAQSRASHQTGKGANIKGDASHAGESHAG